MITMELLKLQLLIGNKTLEVKKSIFLNVFTMFLLSYGSPLGDPLFSSSSDINPRVPLNKRTNLADDSEAFEEEEEEEEEEEDDPLK